ncbi:MAG: serine hydrolase [Cyanobacteria bacterium]|nr:serine hydrolase [Cyanobacteriota bacterium]
MGTPKNLCIGLASLALLVGACQSPEDLEANALEPTAVTAADQQASPTADIEALLAASVAADGPGVAVLVMADGQILYAGGYGLSDIDTQTPITPETVFDLASVSKQMTAIAILILVEQGALALDDPIVEYLPEFEDLDPDNPVLISHLLHHTSGLEDYTGDGWDGSDADFANLDLEAHLTWLNDQDPLDEPGATFEYNNSGYGLLALIVQRVSGQPFADFMATEIFEPTGMTQTLVYDQLGQVIPNQATGYIVDDSGDIEPSSFPSVMAGDGNVFSSLADLAKYDVALRQNTLVSAETLALAFAPGKLADGSPIEDGGESYGMGWQIATDYVHHSGGWLGTSTYYLYYLEPAVSIMVLSNDEAYDPASLAEEIADLLI